MAEPFDPSAYLGGVVIVERARRHGVQAELLRQFAKYGTRQTEALARKHFEATPIYVQTVLETGIMPARVRIVRGPTVHGSDNGVLSATWREAIVEDELPPR